jgi:Ser/Thr protein kinase RdoA (MazF antagonist)
LNILTPEEDSTLVESRYMPAALAALESFAVEPDDIALIAHSENLTYRVTVSGSDAAYTLRLHRPDYNSIEELESEREWTDALNEAGVAAPASILTSRGKHFVLVDIPGTAERRYAGMTTWLDGMPLRDYLDTHPTSEERQRIFARIGGLIAASHNQAAGWEEPPGFTRPLLDLDGLLGEAPRWGRFWEHAELTVEEQRLLLRTRDKLRLALAAYGAGPANFSLIHADINPDNIVYNEGELALIDFDDCAYGWHMYDIAAALIDDAYAADFDAVCDALLDGYRPHRPLASEDTDMLRAFLLVRGLATIGWFHQRPEHAGSDCFEDLKNWVIGECESSEW